jgi:nucleolar protein 56
MPVPDFLLNESAAGYALFQVTQSEEIGVRSKEFLETLLDLYAFSRLVKLVAFAPFKNAAHALENINDISEGPQPLLSLVSRPRIYTLLLLGWDLL